MSVISNNQLAGAAGQGGDAGYEIKRSLRFNSGDSSYLSRTPSTAGNRKTWTWSGWVKRSQLGILQTLMQLYPSGTGYTRIYFAAGDNLEFDATDASGGNSADVKTTRVFRDPSAWYHIVVAMDTTQATAANRLKMYVNGVQETSMATATYPAQNVDYMFNYAGAHNIGRHSANQQYLNGYLADVHLIDGQALSATDFGEYDNNNVWQPKEFEGSYTSTNTSTTLSQTGWTVSTPTSENTIWDGSTSTQSNGYNGGIIGTVSFSPALTNVTKVEVYQQDYVHYLNGSQVNTSQSGTGWHTLYDNSSGMTLNSVGNAYTNNTQTVDIMAIRINDSIVDSKTWTPPSGVGVQSTGANSFYLKFADNSSNAALGNDSSGNSNTWTVNNLVAAVTTYDGVSFDGSGDRLTVVDDEDLAFGTGDFTVEMYFIADTTSGNDILYDSRGATGNSTDGFSIVRNGNQLKTYTSGNYAVTSSTTLSTGQLYHLAVTREGTTQKMYLDGTSVGNATVNNDFSQQKATIGSDVNGGEGWDGFISNVRLVKGTAVYTANFTAPSTALTNVTNTVLLCCQSSSSTTAYTVSPGTITAHGDVAVMAYSNPPKSVIDSLLDTPTNYSADSGNNGGNYATLNPLNAKAYNTSSLSDGNLKLSATAFNGFIDAQSTIAASAFDCYCEVDVTEGGSTALQGIGVGNTIAQIATGAGSYVVYRSTGSIIQYPGNSTIGTVASYTTGDVIGMTATSTQVAFYKNGSLQGTYNHSLTDDFFVCGMSYHNGNTSHMHFNFGQRPFAYTPPTGYKALCTTNLPNPTVADGSTAFDASLYTGNGSTQSISGFNFQPDFVWIKSRTSAGHHSLNDSVRSAGKILYSNLTNAEATSSIMLTAFNSTGFSVGSDNDVNKNNDSFVSWAWDAGTSNTSISAGGLNSATYNQSQDWSGGSVTGATNSGGGWDNAFDGAFGTGAFTYATNTSTLTMPSNTTWSNKFEVYALKYGGTLYVNGTDVGASMTGFTSTAQWHDITSIVGSSGTLSSIGVSDVGTNYVKLFAVRLDGKLLVDSGESVTNVPSLTSTVRANASAGFSIVEYTGNASNSTVGHGLGASPEFIIIKLREDSSGWPVYHDAIGTSSSNYIELQDSAGSSQDNTAFQNTAPSSNVFSIGTKAAVNNNGDSHIAYCFAPVAGYSAFGSYTGNGSSDGPFVYTGFRPKYLLIKRTNSSKAWQVMDTKRDPSNVADTSLFPAGSETEATTSSYDIDFLSNGFKIRTSHDSRNGSSDNYIYACFASHPFKTSRAR